MIRHHLPHRAVRVTMNRFPGSHPFVKDVRIDVEGETPRIVRDERKPGQGIGDQQSGDNCRKSAEDYTWVMPSGRATSGTKCHWNHQFFEAPLPPTTFSIQPAGVARGRVPHSLRMRSTLDRASLRHLLLVAFILLPLFALNARWGVQGNPDGLAVARAAWQFAETGSLDLSGHEFIANDIANLATWYVELDDGRIISNRAPGLIALAILPYLARADSRFSYAPATFVALVTTLLAMLVIWWVLMPLVGRGFATSATLVLALGTTTWYVSSAELWPHGPGQLWAALAVMGLASGSYLLAGSSFALSIITRPITAVLAATSGILEGLRTRQWGFTLKSGAIALGGAVVVLIYNRALFGGWSIRGGYPESVTTGALERFQVFDYLRNAFDMFFHIRFGVLISTPIVGIATFAMIRAWRLVPGWARSGAIAALVYLLVHSFLNLASGEMIAFYRYPLEALVYAMPALAVGSLHMWRQGRSGQVLLIASAVFSIGLQVVHVFYWSCFVTGLEAPACIL